MNSNKNTNKNKKIKGTSLLALLVGVAVSVIFLLMIAHLGSISKSNYIQAQNILELNENGRTAINFLKQYVEVGGDGILQPRTPGNLQLNSTGRTPATPPTGGFAVLPDWVYIGYYGENTPQLTNVIQTGDATPASCAALMDAGNTLQFFSLQSCGVCYSPNPSGSPYDTSQLSDNPSDILATCCQASGSACSSAANLCLTPNYNCGGVNQGAVYQKLLQPVCVGLNCAGANSSASPSGDVLTVYYANRGSNTLTTFTGAAVSPVAMQFAAPLNSYTFQVDNTSSTLQAIDSATGTTPYNVANNIEYMAILVGESDLSASVGNYTAPQMSRFVTYGTNNVYPYRIIAVRVGIVAKTADPILATAPTSNNITVMAGNDGNPIVYAAPLDQYFRKVFTTTIYLRRYQLPDYLAHCTNVSGEYYLKTGGIPFATTWTANDQCCGGAPCNTTDLNTCEATRMLGGC